MTNAYVIVHEILIEIGRNVIELAKPKRVCGAIKQ